MYYRLFATFAFIFALLINQPLMSHSQSINVDDNIEQSKIYVTPDQIVVVSEGIFATIDSTLVEVKMLSYDDSGLFVIPAPSMSAYCPHAVGCVKCGRCTVKHCQHRCIGHFGPRR